MLKFIPVRGRKLIMLVIDTVFHMLKFIPVRGRKHAQAEPITNLRRVEIYPREGTETLGV